MKRRGAAEGTRRACGRFVFAAALALIILAAAGSAGCSGASSDDVGIYLGEWQRVEAGAPDPDFTLTVTAQSDGASIVFADKANGLSETVAGTAGDGYLACTLTTGAEPEIESSVAASPATAPSHVDMRLSLDAGGLLVADLVLADGTLEPIWIYERAALTSSQE